MEKYIIILVILATIYFIQNNLKTTEGFEATATQSVYGVDDLNAINTLAQISRQLMDKGLTVPGNMTVVGRINSTSGYGTGGGWISANGLIQIFTPDNSHWTQLFCNKGSDVLSVQDRHGNPGGITVGNIVANNALDVNAGGGNVLKVDAGGVHCKRNMNIDGSLLINPAGLYGGTINCNTLFTSSGSLSVYKDNNWQKSNIICGNINCGNISCGNINCGNITTDGLNVNGNYRVSGRGMRMFTQSVGDNAAIPVKDPGGSEYPTNIWVCSVQGIRMDWGGNGPGAINQFCYQKDGKWFLRSDAEGPGDGSMPTILAIPLGFFENSWQVENGPGHMGGW